jgi:HEAT repeat protein
MALGEIGENIAAEPVINMLRDSVEVVRVAAAKALGQIGDPIAVAELINSLNDSSMRVREAAAQAIGNMGSIAIKPLIATLGDWDKDIQAIRKALTTIGSSAIKPLISALVSSEDKVSEAAAKVLDNLGWQPPNNEIGAAYYIAKKQWINTVRIGEPAIGALIIALKDPDVWVRTGAIEALGNIGSSEAVEPLIAMFTDRYWNVRDAAVEALVKIGEPAVERLIEILNQRHPALIEYAARALGAIGDEQAIEPLTDALFDDLKRVRKAAAAALEKLGALSSGKRCTNCGKPIPKNYRTGDSCPFCDELLDI